MVAQTLGFAGDDRMIGLLAGGLRKMPRRVLIAAGLLIPICLRGVNAQGSLAPASPAGTAIVWQALDSGFEIAEMPVFANAQEMDRILLARVDPAKFRFVLENDPAGRTLKSWQNDIGAQMVINGGYFGHNGEAVTPSVSNGSKIGPFTYDARHGAFVTHGQTAGIRDLRHEDWRQVFSGADTALVSFPLLLGADGGNTTSASTKRASRSFAAQDKAGRLVFGTTRGAFFTLPDLAAFLKASPLDLSLALNLDGGPFACQAISIGNFQRNFCGAREIGVSDDGANGALGGVNGCDRRLPIVLGIIKR